MLYVFTGDGKGKTSAALGVVVRAVLSGMKVCWISWYKSKDWDVSEKKLSEKMEGIEMYFVGEGFHIKKYEKEGGGVKVASVVGGSKVIDIATKEKHIASARKGLKLVREKINFGDYGLIVLDELNNAVSDGLINIGEVVKVIESRKNTHVVVTGRDVSEELMKVADLVTECRKIKHPYDDGKLAVKGLDY